MGTSTRIKLKDNFFITLKKICDEYNCNYKDLSEAIGRSKSYISDCFGSKCPPKSIPGYQFNRLIDSLIDHIEYEKPELENEALQSIFEELISNSNSSRAWSWGYGSSTSPHAEDINDISNILSDFIDDIDDKNKKTEFLETMKTNLCYPDSDFIVNLFSIDFTTLKNRTQRDNLVKTIKDYIDNTTQKRPNKKGDA